MLLMFVKEERIFRFWHFLWAFLRGLHPFATSGDALLILEVLVTWLLCLYSHVMFTALHLDTVCVL